MDDIELNLIKRAIKGDKLALHEIIKLEQNNIYSTLFYLKKDENDISDIMQNVLLKLTGKITSLKNPSFFKTWLNKIIVNTYYDYLRKIQKKLKYQTEFDEMPKNLADNTASLQESILKKELDIIIKKSIATLPVHYKIPIALREIQGLSYEDISTITNTSIGTVKSRIARARGIIKNEIIKYTKI